MKLLKELLLTTTTCLIATTPVQASSSSFIELTYSNSQIQCGADSPLLNITVDVYHDGNLIAGGLNTGDSILVPSLEGLTMTYEATDAVCSLATPTEMHLTKDDPIPELPAAYDQDSISALLSGLNTYEDLYLVELGTTNTSSMAYDLQDVVFVVNNNPYLMAD